MREDEWKRRGEREREKERGGGGRERESEKGEEEERERGGRREKESERWDRGEVAKNWKFIVLLELKNIFYWNYFCYHYSTCIKFHVFPWSNFLKLNSLHLYFIYFSCHHSLPRRSIASSSHYKFSEIKIKNQNVYKNVYINLYAKFIVIHYFTTDAF